MAYKQLVTPKINIGATAGYCLGYVDNAIGAVAPYRSYSAQIAYEKAKEKGWVTANQNYPRNVWFVMFWSIDNSSQKGLGHVALAFVDNAGNLQIHDSEVHRGARNPYGSLSELASWFGSGGIKLSYLGWSIGCDNVKLLEPISTTNIKKISATTTPKKKVGDIMLLFKENGKIYWLVGNKYTYISSPKHLAKIKTMMTKAGYDTWEHTNSDQIKYIKKIAEEAK